MAAVHADWTGSVGRVVEAPVVADLPIASVAPTDQFVVVELGTGVFATRRKRNGCSSCAQIHGAGLERRFSARNSTVTQLALGIVAPTGDGPVVEDHAGVLVPGIDGHRIAARSKRAAG